MESIIEVYRNYEIRFNTETESFVCDIDDSRSVKKSYPALKKFIDEFIKENYEFKPFKVIGIPTSYGREDTRKIIGIRKDNRFIYEDQKGKVSQFSDYELQNYMLIDDENKQNWVELKNIENEIDVLVSKRTILQKQFKITTLESIKQNFIIQ